MPYKSKKVKGRRMDEHRWLMEQHLGRRLTRFELVHHKNGDPLDNRLENLEVVSPAQHSYEHGAWRHPAAKVCEVCGEWFTPPPTKRATKKTCSKKCRYELTSRTNRSPNSPRSMYREGAYPSEIKSRKRESSKS